MNPTRLTSYAILLAFTFAAEQQPASAFDQLPGQNKVIVNSLDDRLSTVPTNWWTIAHQSMQDVQNTAASRNARIVDISLEQTTPSYAFTVTYVENTGAFFKPWGWYPSIDAAGLATALTTNNSRLTTFKAYDAGGGQIRFLAVMIGNAGKDSKNSWYYPDISTDQIAASLTTNNARLTQISSYSSGGILHYAVVMVAIAPGDATTWWVNDLPPDQVTAMTAANNARLIHLDYIASDGNYNAIMTACGTGAGCPGWWSSNGQTQDQMQTQASQNTGRVISTTTYPGCGGLCYSYVISDNSLPALDPSSAIITRVGGLLRAGGINGVQGLYLKQVGGPVLANLLESFVYEPASSIKVLAHLYSMTQVQNGTATLADPMQNYTNGAPSCPDPPQLGGMEPLSTALQQMMWNSDNARTREVTDRFGASNINVFGASIGLLNTNINHIIGCAGPVPDQMTLADAATLYEGVASGTLLTPTNQASFYSLMAGKGQFQSIGYDFTHLWDTDIPAIMAQSAPMATADQKLKYQNQMNLAYKAGSYTICEDSCDHVAEYYSIAGFAEIPFCNGGTTTLRDYVFGIFLHGGTDRSWTAGKNTLTVQNFTAARAELLREQLAAGMSSCGLTP